MFTNLMLIAHTLADFIFQSKKMVEDKEQLKISAFLKHGLILFFISLLLIINTNKELLKLIGFISIIHIFIDFIKEFSSKNIHILYKKNKIAKSTLNTSKLLLFLIDQSIHILFIIYISRNISIIYPKFLLDIGNLGLYSKNLFIIIYTAFSGAYFIPLVFNLIYSNIYDYNNKLNNIIKKNICQEDEYGFIDEVKTGRWIGILERILMLIFISLNQLTAIGIIISVKSLARFKMMENKIFSEYYLLGTLLSVVYTLTVYYLLNIILSI